MIAAQKLTKTYNRQAAVENLSLSIRQGEIYGLAGPDGAGKTTAIRLLCGALRPDSGMVTIDGLDMARRADQCREKIGYLSQRFSMYEDLTVAENLRFFAEVRGLPLRDWQARSQQILEFVGLVDFSDRLSGKLSGGMKQKLGLATALVTRPRVLLLDEPTTGVDPITRQDFWQLIIRLVSEEGITVLMSTPYMDEATRCTRVGFMRKGRLVAEGTPRALCDQLVGRILEVTGSPWQVIIKAARALEQIQSAQRFGDRLHIMASDETSDELIAELTAQVEQLGGVLSEAKRTQPLLEDVFIALSEESV